MVDWPDGSREFLCGSPVARLATCGADRVPHAVPICFVLIDDRLYSIVDAKPKSRPLSMKRLRNISENPSAAVVIDRYDDDWQRLEYVMLRGAATVVDDEDEYEYAVAALRAKYRQYDDMTFAMGTNPLVRVSVSRVNHWRGADR